MLIKYQHIERFGTLETEGIESGIVHVFPKLDGSNGSIWMEDGELCFGSRNRELSLDSDNLGFMEAHKEDFRFRNLLLRHPDWRLYGEWLVPHTLKTYRDDAWRRFYVFDVHDEDRYIPYEEYAPELSWYMVDYIQPICIMENPSEDRLISLLDQNTFLVKDGHGPGEGIVIKNYDYRNRFGRQTWAKIVRNEFKEQNQKAFGTRKVQEKSLAEEAVVQEFQTMAMVDKVYANIFNEASGWSSKFIPRLLNTVFYDLVKEETWNFIKKLKNPKIDFGRLQKLSYARTKQLKPELF